jgi:RHS repeat-associated protein
VALNGNGYISACSQQLNYVKGARHYELSNHLGNVLSVVSDRKIEVDESYTFQAGGGYIYQNGAYTADPLGNYFQNNPADGIIDGYVAEVISATDYYAFGAPMPGRSWQASEYRFAFNGKENDKEINGTGNEYDFGARIYDCRLGRFMSIDPLTKEFAALTPYQCASNCPIWFIDYDGLEGTPYYRKESYKKLKEKYGHIDEVLTNPTRMNNDQTVRFVRFQDGRLEYDHIIVQGNPNKPVLTIVKRVSGGNSTTTVDSYKEVNYKIEFATNSANFVKPDDGISTLKAIADRLKENPEMYITIYGSTNLPQCDESQQYVDDRAEVIRKQLVDQGVAPDRIVTAAPQFDQTTTTTELTLYEVNPGSEHYNIPNYPTQKP